MTQDDHQGPRCKPHRWDVEKWLPIIEDTDISIPKLTCLRCGRELHVIDTTSNSRAKIAHSIATRLYEGDEYSEVYDAVGKYFSHHLARFNQWTPKPLPRGTLRAKK